MSNWTRFLLSFISILDMMQWSRGFCPLTRKEIGVRGLFLPTTTLSPTIFRGKYVISYAKNKSSSAVARKGQFWKAKMDEKVWRPTVNDVERISWGKPAKKKGTGSRGVPHRLNEDERFLFNQARRNGFLQVTGSGWRSQRRDAPLLNSYRSLCDARGQACVTIHKRMTGVDELVVDLSPLRNPETFQLVADECSTLVRAVSATATEERPNGNEADSEPTQEENTLLAEEEKSDKCWIERPIYQLPPFVVKWELSRSEAKMAGKLLAEVFDTVEGQKSGSRKPVGVRPGKNRRHGGYGIG